MPPKGVKTVSDLIYWQYAKIISDSAGFGKKNYAFVMQKFKELQQGDIFWNKIREYIKEREKTNECIFCSKKEDLTIEHLLPRFYNGPDEEKNIIWICKTCNSIKGSKRLYEFWTIKEGLEGAKYTLPRIAEGKYLKFLFTYLKDNKLLDLQISQIIDEICPQCDLKTLCILENSQGQLSPLCLDGLITLCFKGK